MRTALENGDGLAFDKIDDSIPRIDPSAPFTAQVAAKLLWFAFAFKRRAHDGLDKHVDALQGFLVLALPVEVIVPCG